MHYSKILNADYVDEYKEAHRLILIGLENIHFEVMFLINAFERQESSNKSNEYSFILKKIFHNQFSMLIIDMFKTISDNSGSDIVNLSKFKNSILKNILPKYRNILIERIDKVWNYGEHKKTIDLIKEFRNKLIAHSIKYPSYNEINFYDIEKVFNSACKLFFNLSFQPEDFYDKNEILGFNFNNEEGFLHESEKTLAKFIDAFLL